MGGPGSGIPAGLNQYGGGGGGATGTPAPNVVAGGIGATTAIFGCAPQAPTYGTPGPAPGRYFAGGGAGRGTVAPIGGGAGGGGPGGTAGTTNTGGGGGGGEPCCGAGGSGIVIIRYKYQ
jgi:fibronectin-binding autotransporter adhesin